MPKIKSSQVFDFGGSPIVMENFCMFLLAQATPPIKTQERSKGPWAYHPNKVFKKIKSLFRSKLLEDWGTMILEVTDIWPNVL